MSWIMTSRFGLRHNEEICNNCTIYGEEEGGGGGGCEWEFCL